MEGICLPFLPVISASHVLKNQYYVVVLDKGKMIVEISTKGRSQ